MAKPPQLRAIRRGLACGVFALPANFLRHEIAPADTDTYGHFRQGLGMDLRRLTLRDNPVGAWTFALAAFLAGLVARFAMSAELPVGFPFLTFFPAVILTAYLSGLWPSVAVGLASVLAAWFFFLPPTWSFILYPSTALVLAIFAGILAVLIVIIDVMHQALDRLHAEKARTTQLAEQREILFRELQHRISNNLAIVSALLNLERAEIDDEKAKQALTEASTRLALIAKIHRKLHDPAGAQLRFGPFVEDLCRDVLEASGVSNIVCLVSAAEAIIPSEKIVPVALIVTELISNALEHGFSGRQTGTIRIDLSAQDTAHVLTVSDDGNGLPHGFSLEGSRSMGLRIVQSLTRQIEGEFAMEAGEGTTCRLVFPADTPVNA
jgi:two-component system, sensor histidine kinase PdtaS